MKKTAIFIFIIAVIIGVYFWLRSRKPYLSIEEVDYIRKKVTYIMSVNGEKVKESLSLEDAIDKRVNNTKDGKYTFYADKIYGLQQIQVAIMEGNKVIKGVLIDFKNRTQTDISALIN